MIAAVVEKVADDHDGFGENDTVAVVEGFPGRLGETFVRVSPPEV